MFWNIHKLQLKFQRIFIENIVESQKFIASIGIKSQKYNWKY